MKRHRPREEQERVLGGRRSTHKDPGAGQRQLFLKINVQREHMYEHN